MMIRFGGSKSAESKFLGADDSLARIREIYPNAHELKSTVQQTGLFSIVSDEDKTLGFGLFTSPESDFVVGYSGPTNCLVLMNPDLEVVSVQIIDSGDTVEHVQMVLDDDSFLRSWKGYRFAPDQPWEDIDVVSGATLTSYAIIGAVANRLGGETPSLKFQWNPNLEKVQVLFPAATYLMPKDQGWLVMKGKPKAEIPNSEISTQQEVAAISDAILGEVYLTTPWADDLAGYQGPTSTLIGFNQEGKCVGLVVNETYDNEPYASYLNDDYSFLDFYQGRTLDELSKLDPEENGIDGVSGATMTSQSVAKAIPLAANKILNSERAAGTSKPAAPSYRPLSSYWMDALTGVLTIVGLALSFTKLSRQKSFRIFFQVFLVVTMGFWSGHMISQALAVGWAQNGIPWQVAPGLVILSLAALLVPVFSKHQTYCQHLCPLGAIQQLGRKKLPWSLKLPKWATRILAGIPWVLLSIVVVAGVSRANLNLAALEAFDGFAFRVAGWASISILVVGVLFSLVTPMAYCRFGCPTGAVLNFLKYRGDSHSLGLRDAAAVGLAVVGYFVM